MVQTIYEVTGIGPTVAGRNGEGDLYYTDGDIKISVLVPGCNQRSTRRRRARQSAARGDEESGVGHDRENNILRGTSRRRKMHGPLMMTAKIRRR